MKKIPELEFSSGFVLNPDEFYSPSHRISPFRTSDIGKNLALPNSTNIIETLNNRFEGRRWCYTKSGKEGIALALEALGLSNDDCITIMTTSDNAYISRCVTNEIEKVCHWSREIQPNTAALFVNHEFGYPFRDLQNLKKYDLPIIEDACHSYLANTDMSDMGLVGDFIIFSLPKIYPIQFGGILSYSPKYNITHGIKVGTSIENYLSSVVSFYQNELELTKLTRLQNYHGLVSRFAKLDCRPYFELMKNDVPGVFLFSVPQGVDLEQMKEHGWRHGIECSIFYGEEAFFIPVHQHLSEADLDYFYVVFLNFFTRGVVLDL